MAPYDIYKQYAERINALNNRGEWDEALNLYYEAISDPAYEDLTPEQRDAIFGIRGEKGKCIKAGAINYEMIRDLQSTRVFGRTVGGTETCRHSQLSRLSQ